MSSAGPGLTVMIPLGGIGSRFQKEGYLRPKPFISVLGRPMLLWVLDNLHLGPDDELVIVYDPAFLKAKFWPLITDKFPNVRRVELPGPTRGAAETVLIGLKGLPPSARARPVVLCDGDTFYTNDILSRYRACAEQQENGVFYFRDTDPKPIYSYVTLNGDGVVTDVKEKVKISDNANSGCYCFASGNRLMAECQALLESGLKQLSQDKVGEFYTSGVIKAMVTAGDTFRGLELSPADFHVLGTPAQVRDFCVSWPEQPKARFSVDLDHTLVSAPQVPGDYKSCLPIPENIELVRSLHAAGHYIIIATARRMRTHKGNTSAVVADIGALTLRQLEDYGVPYDEIHFGKPHAHFYVDDLAVDALADISKQTGFYFPCKVQAGSKVHVGGTTKWATVMNKEPTTMAVTAACWFAAGAVVGAIAVKAAGRLSAA